MHPRNARCTYPITDAAPFLAKRVNVRTVDGSEAEFTKERLPEKAETVVLKHAL